jgi:hypothetical protein
MTGRYDTNLPPINLYQGSKSMKGGLGSSILYENPHAVLVDQKLNTTHNRVLNSTQTSNQAFEVVCRICLEEEDPDEAEENPFIVPCKCMGSMKYIHVKCMREWIDSKK